MHIGSNPLATTLTVWCSIGIEMQSIIQNRQPDELDRQAVRKFFCAKPLVERGRPIIQELRWVLEGRPAEEQHAKILPDYCYNIFEAVRKTYFKSFPAVTDIIYVRDQTALAEAKTIEATKKVIQMDWNNLGRLCGIALRCWRFAKFEAEHGVDGEGFDGWMPEKVKEMFMIIFGQQWVEENAGRIAAENPDKILAEKLNELIAPWLEEATSKTTMLTGVACQWSATAMEEFHTGFAAGLGSFIDEHSQLVGETSRSGTYAFLALAWPEIKAMLDSVPKKTLTDLHEWLLPFMRMEMLPYLDIEQLRDVCAPPSSSGIGISLRPPRRRRENSSA